MKGTSLRMLVLMIVTVTLLSYQASALASPGGVLYDPGGNAEIYHATACCGKLLLAGSLDRGEDTVGLIIRGEGNTYTQATLESGSGDTIVYGVLDLGDSIIAYGSIGGKPGFAVIGGDRVSSKVISSVVYENKTWKVLNGRISKAIVDGNGDILMLADFKSKFGFFNRLFTLILVLDDSMQVKGVYYLDEAAFNSRIPPRLIPYSGGLLMVYNMPYKGLSVLSVDLEAGSYTRLVVKVPGIDLIPYSVVEADDGVYIGGDIVEVESYNESGLLMKLDGNLDVSYMLSFHERPVNAIYALSPSQDGIVFYMLESVPEHGSLKTVIAEIDDNARIRDGLVSYTSMRYITASYLNATGSTLVLAGSLYSSVYTRPVVLSLPWPPESNITVSFGEAGIKNLTFIKIDDREASKIEGSIKNVEGFNATKKSKQLEELPVDNVKITEANVSYSTIDNAIYYQVVVQEAGGQEASAGQEVPSTAPSKNTTSTSTATTSTGSGEQQPGKVGEEAGKSTGETTQAGGGNATQAGGGQEEAKGGSQSTTLAAAGVLVVLMLALLLAVLRR